MYLEATDEWRRHRTTSLLGRAILFSLVAHLVAFALLDLSMRLGVWREVNWFQRAKAALLNQPIPPPESAKPAEPPAQPQMPLLFVDVDASQAADEAPKDTPYYSALNSKAANPDTSIDSNVPKITGEQTKIVKTTDTPLPRPVPPQPAPLQPAVPPKPETETVEAQPKPKGGEKLGDLAMAKPALRPGPTVGSETSEAEKAATQKAQERPRRLADVARSVLAGQKMKQEGGVRKYAVESSLNVKATPFGAYDAAIIAAIQQRWFALLDQSGFAADRTGHVALDFHLNYDGRITEMIVVESTVGELLAAICQRAVLDPSPFAKWPSDMRRLVGANFRKLQFTFYYN